MNVRGTYYWVSMSEIKQDKNRCTEVCPTCASLCVGILNHLDETREFQTPETEYHACGTHTWLSPQPGQKLKIADSRISPYSYESRDTLEEFKEKTSVVRGIEI